MTFQRFGLSESILRAVAGKGYTTPTPVQSQAIPHVLAGRDLFACAQTGTGKTAAFALPILHRLVQAKQGQAGTGRGIRVLVLSPTRELAAQIGQSFQAYGQFTGVRSTVVYGGVSQQPQVRAIEQCAAVLVATPGRLLDLVTQGLVDLSRVEVFVLDEADRMLDMGFLPDVRRVIAQLQAHRQTLLFSATLPEAIEQLAETMLRDPLRIRVVPAQQTAQLIEQSVCFVARQHKPQRLAEFLFSHTVTRALVFTRTKRGADRVAGFLNGAGFRAAALHGDKTQATRQRTLSDFRSNRTPILVATDIAARGIDVAGISHVLNYDLPREAETYVHRIGRTGRAGSEGRAVSFCDQDERPHLEAIQRLIRRILPKEEGCDFAAATIPSPTPARTPHTQRRPSGKPRPGEFASTRFPRRRRVASRRGL